MARSCTSRGRCCAWGALATALAMTGMGPRGAMAEPLDADSVRVFDQRLARERGLSLAPVEADGDIHFTVDAAVLFDADGGYSLETYVAVPNTALSWVRSGQRYRAELDVEVRASDRTDGESRVLSLKKSVSAESFEATREVDGRAVFAVTGALSFRPVRVDVEVADLRSSKSTLFGKIAGAHRSGKASLMLAAPRAVSRKDELSSLVFGTGTERGVPAEEPEGAVTHGGVALYPNPTRFVGLGHRVFPVYFEIYQRERDGEFRGEPEPRTLRYRIATTDGTELLVATDEIDAAAGRWGRVQRFDVSDFRTGTYVLSVSLLDPAGTVLDVAHGSFHVLWRDYTWSRDEATVLAEAEVLLGPEEFGRFEEMPPGERAAYLAQFWDTLDGDPTTSTTGLHEKFRWRLKRAEQLYGGIEGGPRSDRGRVLMRYGEPQEIIPMRMPNRRDTFAEVVAEEISGSLSNTVDTADPRLLDFFRRFARGNPAFEIWKYYGGGDPIVDAHRGPVRGMAFIFVDETGVGVYQLGYTNVRGIN